jgi:hypothetical protein
MVLKILAHPGKRVTHRDARLGPFVTLASVQLSSAARYSVGCGLKYTVTKVGKSDGEGTFAGASGNDEDAPNPVMRHG